MSEQTLVTTAQAKLKDITTEQNEIFIQRRDEIQIGWTAVCAREHVFMISPPGKAKSMLSQDITRRIEGARNFTYLMTKDSTRSEVFGPPSISALKADQFRYILDGRLADCHIAFLDEPGKASSAILNSLLTAMNEREFDNGGSRLSIPLMSVFSASNEFFTGEELSALYDRYLFRVHVRGLDADSDFRLLLEKRPTLNGTPTRLTLAETEALQQAVTQVELPGAVLDKVVELRRKILTEANIHISERRWLKGLKAIQATALLRGAPEADETDLEVFQHILWDTMEEKSKLTKIVLSVVNPLNEQLLDLMDQADEVYREIKNKIDAGAGRDQLGMLAAEANNKLKAVAVRMKGLQEKASAANQERIESALAQIRDYNRYVIEHGLGINL